MSFSVYESRLVFGQDITELMDCIQTIKKLGWEPFGTPYPCNSPGNQGYGMMHMVVRKKDAKE